MSNIIRLNIYVNVFRIFEASSKTTERFENKYGHIFSPYILSEAHVFWETL